MLDHFGKPPVRAGELEPWRTHMSQLAGFPHVHASCPGWPPKRTTTTGRENNCVPTSTWRLETFGPDRVFYGGDWPVSTLAVGYEQWIGVLDWATQDYGDETRRKVFADNAAAFYRLA